MTVAVGLDDAHLAKFLTAHVPGFRGPVSTQKFEGGQSNPTFLLEAASGRYVLRRQPAGTVLASAHAVDREYRVMKALAGTDIPVPKVYFLCEDLNVLGAKFFIMEYLDGRSLWDPSSPQIVLPERRSYYIAMIDVLADLALIDVESVGLSDYGRKGNYSARQIDRWTRQYRATETEHIPEMEELIRWLANNIPAESGVALTHGDFRIDNLVFDRSRHRVIGVIDWELSTLGAPLVDLAYFCLMLRLPNAGYIKGLGGLDRSALGLPEEKEILDAFAARTGLSIPSNWSFWIAFHAFRFAAILQGVKKRHLDGNSSSADAPKAATMIGPVLRLGIAAIQ